MCVCVCTLGGGVQVGKHKLSTAHRDKSICTITQVIFELRLRRDWKLQVKPSSMQSIVKWIGIYFFG